jgi:hypothetical protein
MALQALHEHYWPGDGTGPVVIPTEAGYAAWQASVIATALSLCLAMTGAPIGLAFSPVPPDLIWKKRWRRARRWMMRHLVSERVWVLWRVARLLWSPAYVRARSAVRVIAVAPGFNEGDRRGWEQVGQIMGAVPGIGENLYRSLAAQLEYGEVPHRQKHQRTTVLELAYWALKGRG